MATPKQLVECIAKVTGVAVNSVVQHDRNLADVGLRTVAGRGRAAAQVTPTDAANLLIATIASRSVKDSAATVRQFAEQATSLATDIERAMVGNPPAPAYEFRTTSGAAFWVAGFSGEAVQAVAELLSK